VDTGDWSKLDVDAARAAATDIARQSGAELVEVRSHEYAGVVRNLALFDVDGARFSFVPGGEVAVGYGGRFVGTPYQVAGYLEGAAEFGLSEDIAEFVESVTSPRRVVIVPPLLVAVEAVHVESLSYDEETERLGGCPRPTSGSTRAGQARRRCSAGATRIRRAPRTRRRSARTASRTRSAWRSARTRTSTSGRPIPRCSAVATVER
jgi:hypothetical protein